MSTNLSESFNILQAMLATGVVKKCTACDAGYILGPNSKILIINSFKNAKK